jgi:hypothetical protein
MISLREAFTVLVYESPGAIVTMFALAFNGNAVSNSARTAIPIIHLVIFICAPGEVLV